MKYTILLLLLILFGTANSTPVVYNCNTENIFEIVSTIKDTTPILRINSWVDLDNKTLTLPSNSTVIIENGGIDNGIIVGTNTTLSTGLYQIFGDKLTIKGKWCVNHAYAEWFGCCGLNNDTRYIQRCLDTFYQCKLLNRTYLVTTIKLPDNSLLEGSNQGRYQCSTIKQINSYNGDLITTGDEAYSGISVSGIRIIGGDNQNTAIRINVPYSKIRDVICDQYQGNGIKLHERAWGTSINNCDIFGNMSTSKKREALTGIVIDTKGGLVSIKQCNINYYETGILIKRGSQISICSSNISDCSQNEMQRPDACIKIAGGINIDIFDNYIENFNTGIQLLSAKQVAIHNNYINGLAVASFGVDIKGAIEDLYINNNNINMEFKDSWAISIRTLNIDKKKVHISHNDLEEIKLFNIEGVIITQ